MLTIDPRQTSEEVSIKFQLQIVTKKRLQSSHLGKFQFRRMHFGWKTPKPCSKVRWPQHLVAKKHIVIRTLMMSSYLAPLEMNTLIISEVYCQLLGTVGWWSIIQMCMVCYRSIVFRFCHWQRKDYSTLGLCRGNQEFKEAYKHRGTSLLPGVNIVLPPIHPSVFISLFKSDSCS